MHIDGNTGLGHCYCVQQEFPIKSERYDCDAELAREYIDPITMSKIWIWQESMCRIGTRN
jgi:hypothetical protein